MQATPRVAGYGIVRNAEILSYPFYDAFYQCFSNVDEFHVFYDTGSDDRTAALATAFAERLSRHFPVEAHPFRVTWDDQTAISRAQNVGARFLKDRGFDLVLLNQADEFLPEGMAGRLREELARGRQVGFQVIHTWRDQHVIARADYCRFYRSDTEFTGDGANVCGSEVSDFVMHQEAVHHLGALFHPERKYAAHSKLYGSADQAFIAEHADDLDKVRDGFRRLIGAEFQPLDFPLRPREQVVVEYARRHDAYPFEAALEAIEADLASRRTAELAGRTSRPVAREARDLSAPTIILPCYNCVDTLPEAIDSIYRQGLGAGVEIVCVDDGSSDGTGEFLRSAALQLPGLRVLRHEQNRGGAAARNTAVRAATRDRLFCLDADNILASDSLGGLLRLQAGTGREAVAFAELRYFNGKTRAYSHAWPMVAPGGTLDLQAVLASPRTPPASGNYLYTRQSWDRAGGYPEGRGALDAWGFGLRQVATGTVFAVLPGSYYWHRLSEGSYWSREQAAGRTVRDAAALLREVAGHLDGPSRALVEGPLAERDALQWIDQGTLRVKARAGGPGLAPVAPAAHAARVAPPPGRPLPARPADVVRRGDLVFDIGAHGGKKAREYLGLGARVVSFEPQPHRFAELERGLAGTPGFQACWEALTDRCGTIDLWICDAYDEISTTSDRFRSGSRHAKDSSWNRKVEVPCSTLDRAIARHGVPDFCKIDVEGAEVQVLAGLSHPLPAVSVEFHLELHEDLDRCIGLLERLGYRKLNVALDVQTSFALPTFVSPEELREAFRRVPAGSLPWGDVYAVWDGPLPEAVAVPAQAGAVAQAPDGRSGPSAEAKASAQAAAEASLAQLERQPEDQQAFEALAEALASLPGVPVSRFWRPLLERLRRPAPRRESPGPVPNDLRGGARLLCSLLAHGTAFERAYEALADEASRRWMLDLVTLRVLGSGRASVEFDQAAYDAGEAWIASACAVPGGVPPDLAATPTAVASWRLGAFDLAPAGLDARILTVSHYAAATLLQRQYEFRRGGASVCARPGDVVIDGGGCFGETALYFAGQVGPRGRVLSFEFMPANLAVFKRNLAQNPELARCIELVEAPLQARSGQRWSVEYSGPAAKVVPARPGLPSVSSLSLDDVVEERRLERVDFVKLDVEGAEPGVLVGAERTLRRFRPRMAVAVYHEPEHVATLTEAIAALDLGYRLHLDHFTGTWGETVLFARPS